MDKLLLFSDASLNQKLSTGFGGYLLLKETSVPEINFSSLGGKIRIKKFEVSSSTKLEVETLLWALEEVMTKYEMHNRSLIIYTDSQTIFGLPGRKERLIRNSFLSMAKGSELKNASLYKKFYEFSGLIDFEIIKLKGHSRKSEKDDIDMIFSYIDKRVRKELKNHINKKK